MTKFDIRVRRRQFTQSRIERHKNYQSLMARHHKAGKRKTRGIMVLVFILILVIALLMALLSLWEEPKQETPEKDQVSWSKVIKQKDTGINTVYKL